VGVLTFQKGRRGAATIPEKPGQLAGSRGGEGRGGNATETDGRLEPLRPGKKATWRKKGKNNQNSESRQKQGGGRSPVVEKR